jgi:hypothetical protein
LTQPPLEPATPIDYAAARAHESPRPTSVTMLAGIGIVLGSLGMLCKMGNAVVSLLVPMPQPNPMIDAIRDNPSIRTFVAFSAVTGTVISLLLLLSSLGSLALKGGGRAGMLGYAVLALLMTALEQTVSSLVVGPEMLRAIRQSGAPQPPGMAVMSGWVGVAINLLVRLWFPALILYFYNRRHVKEAFVRGLPGKGI